MTTMQAPPRRKTRCPRAVVVLASLPGCTSEYFQVRGLAAPRTLRRPCVLRAVCDLERAMGQDPRSIGQAPGLTMPVRVARALVESFVGRWTADDGVDPVAVAEARDRLCGYVGRIEFRPVEFGAALLGTSRAGEARCGAWRRG